MTIGKIAERIVMNELECRGYRATDLNKDGVSANSDILAAKDGKTWQIQVKGASNKETDRWWVQYGHCDDDIIAKKKPVFNSRVSFYTAQYVAFVAVKSPSKYRCFTLPVREAEKSAQTLLDIGYRAPRRDGGAHRPGKMWFTIEKSERERRPNPQLDKERERFKRGENQWELV